MNVPEIVFGIAALVYGGSLLLFSLPVPRLRFYGWQGTMHSLTAVVVLALAGSLSLVKAYAPGFVRSLGIVLPLDATFDDALASASSLSGMVQAWIASTGWAGVALGSVQGILMLALTPAMMTGVGVVFATVSSYVFAGVFSTLIFMQKSLSAVALFAEGIAAILSASKLLAPAIFLSGVVMFAVPFMRTLGKTFMVVGAALTLVLPPAIVAALPSPSRAQEEMERTAEIQAYSMATSAVRDLEGGVRYKILSRNNLTLWYPYLEMEAAGPPDVDYSEVCRRLPEAVSCGKVRKALDGMLSKPERAILDTSGGGYYDARTEGYRLVAVRNEYYRKVWFMNMWITLHDRGPKRIDGSKIPDGPKTAAYTDFVSKEPLKEGGLYEAWKEEWESFWKSAPLYIEHAEWMVSANRNATFVWFTEQPWGTEEVDLNRYTLKLRKTSYLCWTEQEAYTVEEEYVDGGQVKTRAVTKTRVAYHARADYSGNHSVYFVYLKGLDWDYVLDGEVGMEHEVRESSFDEILSKGFIEGYGPLELQQSIKAVDRDEPLVLNAPTEERKVFVWRTESRAAKSYDGCPALPDELGYGFRVFFRAGENVQPYLAAVEWRKLDEDEGYIAGLASGDYVQDGTMGMTAGVGREEWGKYRIFRQGLYRDGPVHEGVRMVVQKLNEYRSGAWEENPVAFGGVPIAKAVSDVFSSKAFQESRGSRIEIPTAGMVLTPFGAIGALRALSELVGYTAASVMVTLLFSVAVDAVNALVGGRSFAVGFLLSKKPLMGRAMALLGTYASSVRRMARFPLLSRVVARRMEKRMLKDALEQVKRNGGPLESVKAVQRAASTDRVLRQHEGPLGSRRALEGRMGMPGRPPSRIAGEIPRKYTLQAHAYGLRNAKDYGRTFEAEAVGLAGLSVPARIVKDACTRLEGMAPSDSLARDKMVRMPMELSQAFSPSGKAPKRPGDVAYMNDRTALGGMPTKIEGIDGRLKAQAALRIAPGAEGLEMLTPRRAYVPQPGGLQEKNPPRIGPAKDTDEKCGRDPQADLTPEVKEKGIGHHSLGESGYDGPDALSDTVMMPERHEDAAGSCWAHGGWLLAEEHARLGQWETLRESVPIDASWLGDAVEDAMPSTIDESQAGDAKADWLVPWSGQIMPDGLTPSWLPHRRVGQDSRMNAHGGEHEQEG